MQLMNMSSINCLIVKFADLTLLFINLRDFIFDRMLECWHRKLRHRVSAHAWLCPLVQSQRLAAVKRAAVFTFTQTEIIFIFISV